MTLFDKITNAVQCRMSACEVEVETWKLSHEQAKRVFRCEDLIGGMSELFDKINGLNRSFVDDVAQGQVDYSETVDAEIKNLCQRWLKLTIDIRDGLLKICKADGFEVDGETLFLECIQKASAAAESGFDEYALKRFNEISIPLELARMHQTPMAKWPD